MALECTRIKEKEKKSIWASEEKGEKVAMIQILQGCNIFNLWINMNNYQAVGCGVSIGKYPDLQHYSHAMLILQ